MSKYVSLLTSFLVIYLVFIAYVLVKMKDKDAPWKKIEHGSAGWAENGEQYKILNKKSGILLAKENYLPVDKRGNVNVLVIGGSGSGKSASFVTPNAMSLLGSYVFTDPKGELYDKTAAFFKEKGYDIKLLNLVDPSKSDGFNPIFNISSETDLDIVANTVVKGQNDGSTGGDPYWDDNAELLLKSLIMLLMKAAPEEERNLVSCANLVRMANSNTDFNDLELLMSKLPENHKARKNYESVRLASDKAFSSILSTLQSRLGKLETKEIAALTSTNTIDFKELGNKKTVLYVISSDTHSTFDFLLTIFFSQLIQALYNYADSNGGALNVPVYFFLDEFANIGQIPDFDKKISTSRSRKISFNVILQSLDQLENIYPKSFETIMANCDTHLFLGSNSQKTAEYISKQLGEITIWDESESVSKSKSKESKGESTSTSTNKFSRPLMTPDELRRLDEDKCIIIEKGIKPVLADKYYYFKEPAGKVLLNYKADHTRYEVDRGAWREFDVHRKPTSDINKELIRTFDDKEKDLIGITNNSTERVKNLNLADLVIKENKPSLGLSAKGSIKEKNNNKDNTDKTKENRINKKGQEENKKEIEKQKIIKNLETNLEEELEKKFDELFGNLEKERNEK